MTKAAGRAGSAWVSWLQRPLKRVFWSCVGGSSFDPCVRELNEATRRIDEKYRPLLAAAKDEQQRYDVRAEWTREKWEIEAAIQVLQSDRLVNKAHRLLLAIPKIPKNPDDLDTSPWELGPMGFYGGSGFYLKEQDFMELRNQVRQALDERWRRWETRTVVITGLLGTLIGVLSVLKGC